MGSHGPVSPEPTIFEAVKVPLTNPTTAEIVAYTVAVADRLVPVHGRVIGVMPRGMRFAIVARSETLRMQGRAN